MREYQKAYRKQDTQQKRIVTLFCFIIAIVMFSIIFLRTTSAQAAPAEVTYKYYTSIQVEAGDTLWTIASEHISAEYDDLNEYITEVCSINHISKDEIHAGQYLVIPYYATASAHN